MSQEDGTTVPEHTVPVVEERTVPEERTFTQAELDKIVGERLGRAHDVRVTHEERTYALDSPHSFFNDAVCIKVDPSGIIHPDAHARMAQWSVELGHEIEARSAEGRYVERVVREQTRTHRPDEHRARYKSAVRELRALTTGGGSTAAVGTSASVFATPYFLLDEWAPYRGIYRSFADACHNLPIPPWGMQMYAPVWTSTSGAAQQTEGSGVQETDPASAFQGGAVVTITGQVTATQQFSDRGGSGAGWTDEVLHRQLQQQLEEKLDLYTITQAIAGAGVTLNNTPWTANSLKDYYTDLATASEGLTDTAGVRLRPTHVFSTSDFYSNVSHIVDGSGRPILPPVQVSVPDAQRIVGADDGPNGASLAPWFSRFTGQTLPGGKFWFTDDNIPTSGADTQVIVGALDEAVLLLESPVPVFSVFPQTVADHLEIVFNLRSYVSVIVRHASGVQVISGGAYLASSK